ncbi:hypothetical protein IOD16_00155 [Saccharothrix sp. 6-C]|uniref:hypothetical protein n=1 Tax=Saccharothrix sp. 6-C TaxID=2781735 RepID=UPI001916D9DE|nr:hypothetical protein [Saccharothrix sp. 6-C]QQQ77024.1 hypothetical protein IOD16_00155 [Saccharothrix sp. 6-C]
MELLVRAGGDLAGGSIAVGFTLGGDHLRVVNALDENGLEIGPPSPDSHPVPLTT